MNQIRTRFLPLYQNKTYRRIFQFLWIALIGSFIVVAIVSQWDVIQQIEWTGERLTYLSLAIISTLLRRLAGGILWIWIVRLLTTHQSVAIRQSLKVYFIANLATYLPGTYWFIPGRMVMNSKHGVSALQTGVGTLLEQFLIILSGALVSLLGIELVAKQLNFQVQSFWWIFVIVIVGLIAIHPSNIQRILNVMARILKMNPVLLTLSYGTTLLLLFWAFVIWLMGAFTLLFLAKAFIPEIALSQVGIFGAIFAISWLIGFFTPFAPSGIGVREGVMGLAFIAVGIPVEITVLLAALSRFLIIFEDVFWALVGMRL